MLKLMKLWIFFHYASTPDEPFAGPFDLARCLVKKGHEVTIFASSFSHYKFEELRLQARDKWRMESREGVRFVWVKTHPYRQNDWHRIINMLTYGWRSLIVGLRFREKPDVIVGVTVHPVAALVAYLLSVVKRVPFVFEVRDLWPLTLIQFGRLSRNSPITWLMGTLEKFLFQRARRIIATWPRISEYGVSIGVAREKFVWIPQCVDLNRYRDLKLYEGHLSYPFTLMYVGGLVNANALDVILRAASIVQDTSGDKVRFVFVGGGQEKGRLVELSRNLGLRNVEFRGVVPRKQLAEEMGQADAFVLSLQDLPLYKYGVSFNKIGDYMVCGRPILFAGNPGYNPVVEAKAGFAVEPQNPQALARAIRDLMALPPEKRSEMGQNGRSYAELYHSAPILAEKLEQLMYSVIELPVSGKV